MAHNWLSLIREEIGRIHDIDLPIEVLRLANDDQLKVNDDFKVLGLCEEVENWLNSLQLRLWPEESHKSKRPKCLLIYVGFYRMGHMAKLFKDSNEILLSLLSDQKALLIMQQALVDSEVTEVDSSETSSDLDSDNECELFDHCPADEGSADFMKAFKALATQEAANLESEIGADELVASKTLTIIELPTSLGVMNTVWWRCVVDNNSSGLKSAWLLKDHATANELAEDENRRARFSSILRAYIARTHSKYKHIFDGCSSAVTIFVDVLQVVDDNDTLWTVGVEKAPEDFGAQIEDQSNGPLQLAPVRSVYELLFNRRSL